MSADNTIQLRHLLPKQVQYNFLMIRPSINQLSEYEIFYLSINFYDFLFKLLVWRYFKEFLYVFLCLPMPLDNSVWYARVGIFNYRTKYMSSNVRY